MTTTQTTIKKLPPIKEDVGSMKMRIQDLEKEVANYKGRLEELRKAKNNLIIKKTTEYVKQSAPNIGAQREPRGSDGQIMVANEEETSQQTSNIDDAHVQELEKLVENLNNELNESKNLIAALRLENDDLKTALDRTRKEYQIEMAEVCAKHEETKREVKQWEVMYKEWMTMMEDRVTNINRTHQILQQCLNPNEAQEQQQQKQQSNDANGKK